MKAKEFLRQYEEATRRADLFKTEYLKEQDLVDSVRSTLSDNGMSHGSGISKRVEDQAIRLSEKFGRWKSAEIEAIRTRQEVFDVISHIPGREGTILYERYINLRKWEEICVLIHMSWNGTHKSHRRALYLVDCEIQKRV